MILKFCKITGVDLGQTFQVGNPAIDIGEGKAAHTLMIIGFTTGVQTGDQNYNGLSQFCH
jgi:hypothetical protein